MDQSETERPFFNTFADMARNLLQCNHDGVVFNDRRCQSAMDFSDSWLQRPSSPAAAWRQCVSANCSMSSGQSHHDAAEDNRITGSSADDLNQFLSAVDETALNPNRPQQNIDKVVSTLVVNDWVADTEEMRRTAVNVDLPAKDGSSVARISESPSAVRDCAQNNTSICLTF